MLVFLCDQWLPLLPAGCVLAQAGSGRLQTGSIVPCSVYRAQEGEGVGSNMRFALELFRISASLGDPEAQGQMGWRSSLGLQDASSWSEQGITTFGEVRGLLKS